ncbi:MAG: serine/threonine protein kinase [Polyangiaceae bacterium]
MKSCPQCKRVYPDDAGFCPVDGVALQFASMVPVGQSDDPRVGTRLCDRYEIRRVVADGGMGRVYEGIDKQNNSRIAVKVLHSDVATDDVALERFKREYEMSKRLPHDYIVDVHDFQKDPKSGVWLLVMEFLDGEELRVILKREKTIAPERLIRMLSQAAIGLDSAHQIPIVHRDLKPDNLFMCGTREGDVTKLLDFGSVKDKTKDAKKLTVLGTTIGTPYYMAPEQAQGLDTLDARADVFALGAIAYECVCGTVPFAGTNGPSILLAIMTKDPEPPSIAGAKQKSPPPPALDDVLEEALAKNPNIRTKTVGALADAVGKAYGLTGDHKQWATTSQAELAHKIATAPRPRAIDVAADPFAAPDPFAGPAPAGVAMAPAAPPRGMDAAFQASREADYEQATGAGLPAGRPPWLIPVIVGVAALILGGGIALFAVLGH